MALYGHMSLYGQVSLPQDLVVVDHVTGRDEGERADGERMPARDAPPAPRLGPQAAEERQGGVADGAKLLHVTVPRPRVRARGGHRDVLVEARQRCVEPAREPEGARHEQPLGVVYVTRHLADAPLVRRVTMQRRRIRDSAQEIKRLVPLG